MKKPEWNEAPSWAMFLGFDSTGGAYWHELEPKLYATEWYGKGRTEWAGNSTSIFPRLEKRP